MGTNRRNLILVAVLALAGCGNITGNVTEGGDIPAGAAVPAVGSGEGCTRSGAGVDATVTPAFDTGVAIQGAVWPVPAQGLDPQTPPCFDLKTQKPTAPAVALTSVAMTIKDGVLQAIPDARIVTQWFIWYEPTPGTCQAGLNAVVEVPSGSGVCAVELVFGSYIDVPISSYSF